MFPNESSVFLIPGPAGFIEVGVDWPRTDEILPITFVMCHPNPVDGGTMTNKVVTTTCSAMNRLGIPTVRFNYRGVGNSDGQFGATIGEGEDLTAVLTWLADKRPGKLWLGGFSFGTFIAYRAANDWPVEQLLTIAPANDRYDYLKEATPSMPWLAIVPDADEIVDLKPVMDFLLQVPADVSVHKMHGASHFFHRKLINLREYLMRYYQEAAK